MFGTCHCNSLRQAMRKVTQLYDEMLAPVNLRATQYALLAEIERLGSSTLLPLAEALVMDRATLGHNLRPLETAGYVTMSVGQDRRSREVSLTAAGRRILTAARPLWSRAQQAFEKEIGRADAEVIRALMHQIARSDFDAVGR
jgi:DNA-binding MarR family transcriptional regulator